MYAPCGCYRDLLLCIMLCPVQLWLLATPPGFQEIQRRSQDLVFPQSPLSFFVKLIGGQFHQIPLATQRSCSLVLQNHRFDNGISYLHPSPAFLPWPAAVLPSREIGGSKHLLRPGNLPTASTMTINCHPIIGKMVVPLGWYP